MAKITFIDLFAGIGGFHIAFHDAKARCVFASEKDSAARNSYVHNFVKSKEQPKTKEFPYRDLESSQFNVDITDLTRPGKNQKISPLRVDHLLIPNFDVMCGGFPCQPFSNAGLRLGFAEDRGTLFEDMVEILSTKIDAGQPAKAFFLENVRGLKTHMSGTKRTIELIEEKLRGLGYSYYQIEVKASDFGVPQHRPRLFLIGFFIDARGIADLEQVASEGRRFDEKFKFFLAEYEKNLPLPMMRSLEEILGATRSVDNGRSIGYTLRVGGRGSGIGDRRNWDWYNVDGQPKRIEWSEGLALQGFPSEFVFPESVSDSQRMKQLGNSVAVPAVRYFARAIASAMQS